MGTRSSRAVMLVVSCLLSALDVPAQQERGLRQLTSDPAQDGFPRWSPDGQNILFSRYGGDDTRIAFKEESNIWVLDVSTGRFQKVLSEPGKLPIPACWSHDGKELYVWMREVDGPNPSLWLISASGQGCRQLTFEKESAYRYADLSPDGSLLSVVWCEDRNCDLWIMSCSGGNRAQITSHPSYDDGLLGPPTGQESPSSAPVQATSTSGPWMSIRHRRGVIWAFRDGSWPRGR
jgi:Tol biopolymer transport system component